MQSLLSTTSPGVFGSGAPLRPGATPLVNDIWLIDDTHHGVSVDLNAGRLNAKQTWDDGARNLLNLIKHVIPFYAAGTNSWQLDWHDSHSSSSSSSPCTSSSSSRSSPSSPSSSSSSSPASSLPQPRVIGLGHSIGGNNVVLAASSEPDLFAGVFLIEPMCAPKAWDRRQEVALMTLKRRDTWSSLEAARGMRTSPLCRDWTEEMFDLWLKFALVPHPSGGVTLATPRWCEAACFATPSAPQRAWDALETLKVPAAFLMAKDTAYMGGDEASREMCHRPSRAKNEVADAGHLVVQEKPRETGEAVARFLATLAAGRWDQENARL